MEVVGEDMRRARQVDRVAVRDSRGKDTSSGLRDKGKDKEEEDAVETKARGEDFQSIIAAGVKRVRLFFDFDNTAFPGGSTTGRTKQPLSVFSCLLTHTHAVFIGI